MGIRSFVIEERKSSLVIFMLSEEHVEGFQETSDDLSFLSDINDILYQQKNNFRSFKKIILDSTDWLTEVLKLDGMILVIPKEEVNLLGKEIPSPFDREMKTLSLKINGYSCFEIKGRKYLECNYILPTRIDYSRTLFIFIN